MKNYLLEDFMIVLLLVRGLYTLYCTIAHLNSFLSLYLLLLLNLLLLINLLLLLLLRSRGSLFLFHTGRSRRRLIVFLGHGEGFLNFFESIFKERADFVASAFFLLPVFLLRWLSLLLLLLIGLGFLLILLRLFLRCSSFL